MLRYSSPVERVLTYATFLTLSIALHMIVVLGTRTTTPEGSKDGVADTSSRTAQARPQGDALR
jgi:hypothetical protein